MMQVRILPVARGVNTTTAHPTCDRRVKVDHHPVSEAPATRPCIDVDLPAPHKLDGGRRTDTTHMRPATRGAHRGQNDRRQHLLTDRIALVVIDPADFFPFAQERWIVLVASRLLASYLPNVQAFGSHVAADGQSSLSFAVWADTSD